MQVSFQNWMLVLPLAPGINKEGEEEWRQWTRGLEAYPSWGWGRKLFLTYLSNGLHLLSRAGKVKT